MNFKPIEEFSLRHLFSSELGESVLNMSYLGPVMNGQIPQTSPDCLVIDRNTQPFSIKRCEFKFKPSSVGEFAMNGQFQLAIIWDLGQGLDLHALEVGLLQQNGCQQIKVLNQIIEFNQLPDYQVPDAHAVQNLQDLERILINNSFETNYVAYLFAHAYPQELNLKRIKDHLRQNFPAFAALPARGQHNQIINLWNRGNPIIRRTHGEYYRWHEGRNVELAKPIISIVILRNFGRALPNLIILPQLR
ncbi:MAG: hypothetical protein M0Q51_11890 [Bacteroidales bacterium]|nr:hypothetical protein [Bacteroidales bacterium]